MSKDPAEPKIYCGTNKFDDNFYDLGPDGIQKDFFFKHRNLCESAEYIHTRSGPGSRLMGGGIINQCMSQNIDDFCHLMSYNNDIGKCNLSNYCKTVPNGVGFRKDDDNMDGRQPLKDFKANPTQAFDDDGAPGGNRTDLEMEKYCWN